MDDLTGNSSIIAIIKSFVILFTDDHGSLLVLSRSVVRGELEYAESGVYLGQLIITSLVASN